MSTIALFAHPGHELRALGWCMRHRPTVIFLTNGQGSGEKGRLATSVRILTEIGCRVGAQSGTFADREIYEAILEGRADTVARFYRSVLEKLNEPVERLIFDRTEGFNPTHDLVSLLGRQLARRIADGRNGSKPSAWAISLEALPCDDELHSDSDELCRCNDEELQLKLKLAESYEELAAEVADAIRQAGAEAFRTEWGRRIDLGLSLEESVPNQAAFERYGEERVRQGIYSRVLRRNDHLLPFFRNLLGQLESGL